MGWLGLPDTEVQEPPASSAPPALRCVIHAEHSIDELATTRPPFSVLEGYLPCKSKATLWKRSNGDSYDLTVVALGKTGYGKSTTLNTLLGESAFETSDIGGCTRKLQSVEYRFKSPGGQYFLSFADLPGLGETPELDAQYYPLYRDTLRAAQVVLYFVRADQRDYSVDQRAFAELVNAAGVGGKVLLVVNAIDKIEPLNRSWPFELSAQQRRALDEKIAVLRGMFSLPQSAVIPVSGAEGYNLDRLASAIMSKLSASLVQV
jgi:small GTP-binding protein